MYLNISLTLYWKNEIDCASRHLHAPAVPFKANYLATSCASLAERFYGIGHNI